ncbi:MAG: ABC transporter ATP-binding protein [Bdellovibrionales bacterium]|nr:ABC transporter ATP-binding protein [Bdellovibrionales bacterium]
MKIAIEARSLAKNIEGHIALQGVHFSIRVGTCFAFLGPNGSGKSVLLEMIGCLSLPSAGELFVLGHNVRQGPTEIKMRTGIIPQLDLVDPDFTAYESLMLTGIFYRMNHDTAEERARELMRRFQLEEVMEHYPNQLNAFDRRKLQFARALIHDPELILIDEPTEGLDSQMRTLIWGYIKELKEEGKTVVLASHAMADAEQLCDQVALMNSGRIICEGKPAELVRTHVGAEVVEFECPESDLDYLLGRVREKYDYQVLPRQMRLFLKDGQDGKTALSLIASDMMTVRRARLDDVHLRMTGIS